MSDYDSKTMSELRVLFVKEKTILETIQSVNSGNKHDVLISESTAKIGQINEAIVNLMLNGESLQIKPELSDTVTNYDLIGLDYYVKEVPVFTGNGGGIEVDQFLGALDNIRCILVEPNMEAYFLKLARMQTSPDVSVNVKTYDEFKRTIRKQYGGQLTMYQMLSSVWDVEYNDPKSAFIVYGQTIQSTIRTAKDNILSDHKVRTGKDMTIDEYNDVISGMLMMDKVKRFHPEIYRTMVSNSETENLLKNSVDVARQAETLRSRYQGDSLSGHKDESYYGNTYEYQPSSEPEDDRYYEQTEQPEQTERPEHYYGSNSNAESNESTISSSDEHSASEHYASPRRRKRQRKKSLYVGGLSSDTDEDELFCYFSRFGEISDIYIPEDHNGDPRGFGFVRYYEREDAKQAKYDMDNACIDGHYVSVKFATTRSGVS